MDRSGRASSRRSTSRPDGRSSSGTASTTWASPESYETLPADPGKTYDYFHINAVELLPNGHMLVSARNTHAVYEIRRSDGAVLSRLGGKRSDFVARPGARFAWQHDARLHGRKSVTIFDNGAEYARPGPP